MEKLHYYGAFVPTSFQSPPHHLRPYNLYIHPAKHCTKVILLFISTSSVPKLFQLGANSQRGTMVHNLRILYNALQCPNIPCISSFHFWTTLQSSVCTTLQSCFCKNSTLACFWVKSVSVCIFLFPSKYLWSPKICSRLNSREAINLGDSLHHWALHHLCLVGCRSAMPLRLYKLLSFLSSYSNPYNITDVHKSANHYTT